jgi:hypothetical protein
MRGVPPYTTGCLQERLGAISLAEQAAVAAGSLGKDKMGSVVILARRLFRTARTRYGLRPTHYEPGFPLREGLVVPLGVLRGRC